MFDYSNPAASIAEGGWRRGHEIVAARAAAAGEPLRTLLRDAARCTKSFAQLGFRSIEDLGPNEIAARFFPERAAPSRENGGHFALAGTS